MEERSERCSGSKRKGEESEQWITKTSVLPHLFSFLLDFLRLLVVLQAILFPPSLPPSSCSLFLFPSPYCPRCRSSAAFLLPRLPDYCLLLFASLSVSISLTPASPGVFCLLLILTRQTLCKRWVLFWTWSCAASFHTPQPSLSLHKISHAFSPKNPPRVKERCQRRTLSPHW